jgi:hypothetical protein
MSLYAVLLDSVRATPITEVEFSESAVDVENSQVEFMLSNTNTQSSE